MGGCVLASRIGAAYWLRASPAKSRRGVHDSRQWKKRELRKKKGKRAALRRRGTGRAAARERSGSGPVHAAGHFCSVCALVCAVPVDRNAHRRQPSYGSEDSADRAFPHKKKEKLATSVCRKTRLPTCGKAGNNANNANEGRRCKQASGKPNWSFGFYSREGV